MEQMRKPTARTIPKIELPWVYELYRLGRNAAFGNDTANARERLLRHIVTAFGAKSASLAETNENRPELTIVAAIDLPPEAIGSVVAFGQGVMGWVAEHREPLLLNGNLASDARFGALASKRERAAPSSALCWPLLVENETVGVISINRGAEQVPFTEADLREGYIIIRFVAVAVENARLQSRSARYVQELRELVRKLEETQSHLMQSEKMASIGQLAAGVAHEINNPIGYISSNLNMLQNYTRDLLSLLEAYEAAEPAIAQAPELQRQVRAAKERVDVAYLKEDLGALLHESQEGVGRVRQIVQDLKDFSHVDEAEWQPADLHNGIDSTLNIVNNELKYKAEVIKDYGELPMIECMPSQLNQVFMNMLVNAAQALEERGTITVRTRTAGPDWVCVEISDTGKGIAPEHLNRLFEPFFTTKPVGQGTGLGLSLSYGIVEKHGGRIEVESTLGEGSTFRICLPVNRAEKTVNDRPAVA